MEFWQRSLFKLAVWNQGGCGSRTVRWALGKNISCWEDGSGFCSMGGFDINSVELSGSATSKWVSHFVSQVQWWSQKQWQRLRSSSNDGCGGGGGGDGDDGGGGGSGGGGMVMLVVHM